MLLKVQISDYDSYQHYTLNLDQLYSQVSRVPIVRIYGSIAIPDANANAYPTTINSTINSTNHSDLSNDRSQSNSNYNVVVHVHNYYPYIYVDCNETSPDLPKLIAYLELALKNSLGKRKRKKANKTLIDVDDDGTEDENPDEFQEEWDLGQSSNAKRKFVANVALCKGTPIYGFNVGYKPVYKISLLSPLYKATLVRLINEDVIVFGNNPKTHSKRNIYEGHIPFLLQFVTDFNLFGCSFMDIDTCYWRFPIFHSQYRSHMDKSDALKLCIQNFISPTNVLHPELYHRTSHSMLEFDIRTELILNRKNIKIRNLHQVLSRVNFESQEKHLSSLNLLSKDIAFQSKSRGIEFDFRSQLNRSELTGSGGTKWSNQQELDDLLEYVNEISGNSPGLLSTRDYNKYSEVHYKDKTPGIPTAMDLITSETQALSYHGGLLLLSFDKELLKWHNIDDLWWEAPKSYTIVGTLKQVSDEQRLNSITREHDAVPNREKEEKEKEAVPPPVLTGLSNLIDSDDSFSFSDENNDDQPNISFSFSQIDNTILTQRKRSHFEAFKPQFSNLLHKTLLQAPESCFPPHSKYSFEAIPPDSVLKENVVSSLDLYGIPKVEYVDPHYDNVKDSSAPPLIFANKQIVVPCIIENSVDYFSLEESAVSISESIKNQIELNQSERFTRKKLFGSKSSKYHVQSESSQWDYIPRPPSKQEITHWLNVDEPKEKKRKQKFISQLERFTANDYKYSYRSGEKVHRRANGFIDLTILNLEIHSNTLSDEFLPKPKEDAISFLVYSYLNTNIHEQEKQQVTEIMVLLDLSSSMTPEYEKILEKMPLNRSKGISISRFYDEEEMIGKLVERVRYLDPDILCGYEIISNSWGYVIERFRTVYEINLCHEFSRSSFKSNGKVGDRWGYTHTSNIKIPGRHMLNIWRLLRHEVSLTNYSLENVANHLIHQKVPKFLNYQLTSWFKEGGILVEAVLKYYVLRIQLAFKFIDVQEILLRNCEQSRLIGVDFYSNFYRGSQYKVESILVRLTKAENVLLNSPSKLQVHNMRSLECIPLVMEPDLNFYKSPLIVLDFQSLYPSVMIAYNYCYSTLLGKLKGFEIKKNEVGYLSNLKLAPGLINILQKNEDIIVSPNGYMFVKSRVRKSILAKMLEEVLEARINVKSLMKLFSEETAGSQEDAALKKLYNSKQLALKLIANVTYGYTSATYSGRMPNSDIADAIVSTARELLTQSVDIIEKNLSWGAKVVYGDTDSLFVYLPGKSKNEAFKIGREISSSISKKFPNPIYLKFEKVYHPCVLLSKKRYVGYSYEYEGQKIPKFDAKGIETIRRDGIPAQQIILERSLRLLFDTKNLSMVKSYVTEQFMKIILNKASVKDFCFAKEVRYGTYKNEKYLPPGAVLAKQKIEKDKRSEPQYKERVPYLVIRDSSKVRIKDRVVSPDDFVESFKLESPMHLDYEYYITRVLIPPLERIFNLIGVDIKGWYKEIPKLSKITNNHETSNSKLLGKSIQANNCLICNGPVGAGVENDKKFCQNCVKNELQSIRTLNAIVKENDISTRDVYRTCDWCIKSQIESLGVLSREFASKCENLDCNVYYERLKVREVKSKENLKAIKNLEDW